jgi:hypothetical protein
MSEKLEDLFKATQNVSLCLAMFNKPGGMNLMQGEGFCIDWSQVYFAS